MRSVAHAALDMAALLGYQQAGEEHLLVASVDAGLQGELREALEARSITGDRARAALVASMNGDDRREPRCRGTSSGPTYHRALGRAQGLALAGGHRVPTTDDLIRGCLWDEEGPAAELLVRLGAERHDLVEIAGGLPETPDCDPLVMAAEHEAIAMGDGFVGSWHVVLALLAGRPDSGAADVLRACGVTHDRYAAWFVAWVSSTEPPASRLDSGSVPTLNPACRQLLGRAEALASAGGAPSVGSDHGLVAWLWEDHGQPVLALEALDTTAAALLNALAARDIEVPAVLLPEPDRRPWGETVYFPVDRLERCLLA